MEMLGCREQIKGLPDGCQAVIFTREKNVLNPANTSNNIGNLFSFRSQQKSWEFM
jgi:hypothetical protein